MEVTAAMAAMVAVAEMVVMAAMAAMAVMAKKLKCIYLMSHQFCAFFALTCISINGLKEKTGHRVREKETIEFSHPLWMLHRFGIGECYCSRLCLGVGMSLLA
jgi:hypothetical protein